MPQHIGPRVLTPAEFDEETPAPRGRQPAVEHTGVTAEGRQQPIACQHFRDEGGVDRRRVSVQGLFHLRRTGPLRSLSCYRPGKSAGSQGEADPFPCPGLEQARGVTGNEHAILSQRGSPRSASRDVPGILDPCKRCQAVVIEEVLEVPSRAVTRAPRRDHPYRKPVILGKDPGVRAGDRPPVKKHPAPPQLLYLWRDGYLSLQPQIDLPEGDADVPRGHAGRTVGADHDPGSDGGSVGEPCPRAAPVLAYLPDKGPLQQFRAVRYGLAAKRIVEL